MSTSNDLPARIFACGDEPHGVRVTSYGSARVVRSLMSSLSEVERTKIRESPFGNFISLADHPAYSGRFGRFLLSRQLNVSKKHEIWFLFSGRPIRFSLREFYIVTGLPCGKLPVKSKSRLINNLNSTPYWPSLFGKLESVSVSSVLKMLKRHTVTDSDIRMKYAYLALLASVLLSTTHNPKIIKEHAEMIADLPSFFMHPWSRFAFDMLICSIKEKNVVVLSQNCVAVKGFVHAIQLVLIEAVPSLLEVVQVNSTSSFESECVEEVDSGVEKEVSLSPAHARFLHETEKAPVDSIIWNDGEANFDDKDFSWSDDDQDEKVDNMVRLISDQYSFTSSMFQGGLTKADVAVLANEAKQKNARNKGKRVVRGADVSCSSHPVGITVTLTQSQITEIADIVGSRVTNDLRRVEDKVADLGRKLALESVKALDDIRAVCDRVTDVSSKLVDLSSAVGFLETDISLDVTQQMLRLKSAVLDSITGEIRLIMNIDSTKSTSPHNVCGLSSSTPAPAHFTPMSVVRQPSLDAPSRSAAIIGSVLAQLNTLAAIANESVVGHVGVDNAVSLKQGNSPCDGISNYDNPLIEPPSYSLGLTQEDPDERDNNVSNVALTENIINPLDDVEAANGCRKSKRLKVIPQNLFEGYHCDKQMLTRVRESHFVAFSGLSSLDVNLKLEKLLEKLVTTSVFNFCGTMVTSKDFLDVPRRKRQMSPKMVDVIMSHCSSIFQNPAISLTRKIEFLDTKFTPLLVKNNKAFSKNDNKLDHQFQVEALEYFTSNNPKKNLNAQRFYLPFNFGKTHWVGICLDLSTSTLTILGSDDKLKTDVAIFKELTPLALLFPYFLKQAGRRVAARDLKQLVLDRPKCVPQNGNHLDSALTCVLLIHAHAIGGLDLCRCITPDALVPEAERLMVMMYEDNVEILYFPSTFSSITLSLCWSAKTTSP